jgi:hypothetical protein
VGDATQTVEVKADTPLVNSENASVGQAITTKEVEDLPLNGGSAMQLAQLAIGVIPSPFNSSSTVVQPYESTNSFSIGGTPTQTSEVLLDGAPNASWDNRSAFTPPRSAVQEVRVKTFDSDVAFGHTGGGTINMILKSGGNSVHGSLYENNQPSNLTANNFFNNRNNLGNPVTHYNLFGVSAGGPVWIPKVFNGRNKLFWFVAWEGSLNSQPNNNTLSVPTAEEKKGDFGIILQTDKTVLYDPHSATQTGSTINRVAYPNNVIPTSQLNPIALKYMQFYPAPNVSSGATFKQDGYNNYGNNATSTNRYYSQLGRLDYNLNEKNRLFFDVRHNTLFATKNSYFQNISTGTITNRENWGASLDEVYIANPSNIFNVRLNFTALVREQFGSECRCGPDHVWLPILYVHEFAATGAAVHVLQHEHAGGESGYQFCCEPAVAVECAVCQLDACAGEPHIEAGHGCPAVPAEHDHVRCIFGEFQFWRQQLGAAVEQFLVDGRAGAGHCIVPVGPTVSGLI